MLVLIKEGHWIDSTTVLSIHQHEDHVDIATAFGVIQLQDVSAAEVAMLLNISDRGPSESTSESDLGRYESEDMSPKMSSTDYDHRVAKYHNDGWNSALEEVYRRIAASRAGTQTRGLAYDQIVKFLQEQIPEKIAAIDGEWLDSKVEEGPTSKLFRETASDLKEALKDISSSVPIQKVAGPETPPDAPLVYADNGVKVSQLRIEQSVLDGLVTKANDGANISNYAMSRRLMQLLGIEVR